MRPPEAQDVVQGLVEGDHGLPARALMESGGVAHQARSIRRPQAIGGNLDSDVDPALLYERIQQRPNRYSRPSPQIVGCPGLAAQERQLIGPNDVARVAEAFSGK